MLYSHRLVTIHLIPFLLQVSCSINMLPLTSKSLGGDFQHSTEWVSDFEVDFASNSDLNEARSESGYEKVARQAIERDALRKYVRKRYLKHGESR
jgi:hypothetical protein